MKNTSRFIENRLVLITKELDGVEKDVQGFKQSNNLTDIETESKYFVEGSKQISNKIVDIEIQIGVVSSLIDFTLVLLFPSIPVGLTFIRPVVIFVSVSEINETSLCVHFSMRVYIKVKRYHLPLHPKI